MHGPELEAALARLDYSTLWVDAGILDPAVLPQQLAGLPDDPHTEHYRYATMLAFLSRHDRLSDQQFDDALEIIARDPDPTMAGSMLLRLLAHSGLTAEQWDRVAAHPRIRSEFPKEAERVRLLQALADCDQPSPQFIQEAIAFRDARVHHALLELALDEDALTALAERGANRKVRHDARLALHRLKKTK